MIDINNIKPGSKVQIIPLDELKDMVKSGKIAEPRHSAVGWNDSMDSLCGNVVTITSTHEGSALCCVKENRFTWDVRWLRPAVHHINIMEDGA